MKGSKYPTDLLCSKIISDVNMVISPPPPRKKKIQIHLKRKF
jgi:hypothetical protein